MSAFFICTHHAFAADYSLSYSITYTIQDDGSAIVNYTTRVTNLTDALYATSQSITLTQSDVSDINMQNGYGLSEAYTTKKIGSETTIATTFTNPAVGSGSVDIWKLQYKTHQISQLQGGALDILIPGFGDRSASNISTIGITLIVPKTFTTINYASPQPKETKNNATTISYIYTDDQVTNAGINLLLGKNENYTFSFTYPVSNASTHQQSYTIAVPADSATQKIAFTTISPKPDNFSINEDGNYILTYILPQKTVGTIHVAGIAQVSGTNDLLNNPLAQKEFLSTAQNAAYTKPDTYWQTKDPKIVTLAKQLTANATSPTQKAKNIYDYLVKTFKYNKQALYDKSRSRKGAVYAITHPDDVICQEYVDAFVALARSVGIPAEFIAGYGNTLSPVNILPPNVLHAWAMYFDPSYGWVPVDPTWGASGLDYFGNVGASHLMLTTYGYHANAPILVSSFIAGSTDNSISFSPTSLPFPQNIQRVDTKQQVIAIHGGVTEQNIFQIKNTGNRILFITNAKAKLSNTSFSYDAHTSDTYVFPSMSGSVSIPIQLGSLTARNTYSGSLGVSIQSYASDDMQTIQIPLYIIIAPIWYVIAFPFLAVIFIFVLSYVLVSLSIRAYHRFAKK